MTHVYRTEVRVNRPWRVCGVRKNQPGGQAGKRQTGGWGQAAGRGRHEKINLGGDKRGGDKRPKEINLGGDKRTVQRRAWFQRLRPSRKEDEGHRRERWIKKESVKVAPEEQCSQRFLLG
jgi:hypothetical protein